jgi:hypothetical protein
MTSGELGIHAELKRAVDIWVDSLDDDVIDGVRRCYDERKRKMSFRDFLVSEIAPDGIKSKWEAAKRSWPSGER